MSAHRRADAATRGAITELDAMGGQETASAIAHGIRALAFAMLAVEARIADVNDRLEELVP